MRFEYDPRKSESNKEKHGIDFEEAQALWEDADRLEIPVRFQGEARFAVIGRYAERHWTAIITYRRGDTRIISVRRSRKKEVDLYEQED